MKVAVIKDESSREYVLKSSDFWGKKMPGSSFLLTNGIGIVGQSVSKGLARIGMKL